MTRSAIGLLLAGFLFASSAAAQQDPSEADVPDVPSGTARIVGAVENPDAPDQVGGIELLLYALPPSGQPGLRRATSDASGAFVFEGVSNDPGTAYLVGARYSNIPYPGDRLSFQPGETEKTVRVRIGEPSPDASKVSAVETQMELAWAGGRIGVTELVRFANRGARTAYVTPAQRGTAGPLFRIQLPDGAEDFQIPLGIQPEGLVREGNELRFYGPLYPSSWPGPLARDQGLAFHYTLPGASGPVTIARRFPSATERVVIAAPAAGPKIQVAGAREEAPDPHAAEPAADEKPGRRFVLDRVPAGKTVEIHIDVPETRVDPDAVKLLETRIFLELDDAALQVQEEHVLEVHGNMPVIAADGGVLLTIPVPEGATDVRFDRNAFALGIAPDDAGGALLRGPLPPGETKVQIAYHLPAGADGVTQFEKRFGRRLPLLNVFVADTGLRAESDRLHRRRPVKTTDRTYVALEAFEVEPDETVKLSLAPLAAPAQPPRAALIALVALAAGLVFAFVAAPLRPEKMEDAADDVGDTRSEREAVYAALRDLDHDHETGKLAEADYAAMRRELRARAAALIRATPATAPPAAKVAPAAPACGACGAPVGGDDHFCARCGARLGAPAEESRA